MTERNVTEGELTEGELTEGELTEGELTEGDVTEGDVQQPGVLADAGSTLDQRMLQASRACVAVLLEAGTVQLGVADICARANLAQRTFHRYFPTKPELIRPLFTDMSRRFNERLLHESGSLRQRAEAAFATEVLGAMPHRTLALIALLRTRRDFTAAYLEAIERGERSLASALEHSAFVFSRSQARMTAVALVAASRLALECGLDGADPRASFAAYLDQVADANRSINQDPQRRPSPGGCDTNDEGEYQ